MENFPRDMIIQLALEYDLSTIMNFCRTSKRMNTIICDNNIFWINKLNKDFNIQVQDIENFKNFVLNDQLLPDGVKSKELNIHTKQEKFAKEYYIELSIWINDYPDINKLLFDAIQNDRLDLVKIALDRGANINHIDDNMTPLIKAVIWDKYQIADYILKRIGVDNFLSNISKILSYIAMSTVPYNNKSKLFIFMYDEIFPRIYHLEKYKRFWATAVERLEAHRNILPELYDRRINELEALI